VLLSRRSPTLSKAISISDASANIRCVLSDPIGLFAYYDTAQKRSALTAAAFQSVRGGPFSRVARNFVASGSAAASCPPWRHTRSMLELLIALLVVIPTFGLIWWGSR
jgi:hypothetical protein